MKSTSKMYLVVAAVLVVAVAVVSNIGWTSAPSSFFEANCAAVGSDVVVRFIDENNERNWAEYSFVASANALAVRTADGKELINYSQIEEVRFTGRYSGKSSLLSIQYRTTSGGRNERVLGVVRENCELLIKNSSAISSFIRIVPQ